MAKTSPHPLTTPVVKAVEAIHIAPRNKMLTNVMRRVFNALLKLAGERWKSMPVKEQERLLSEIRAKRQLSPGLQTVPAFEFSCQVIDVLNLIGYDHTNAKSVYQAMRELRACEVEWNLRRDNNSETFFSGMLSEAVTSTERGGALRWSYGIRLFEMLLSPEVFQPIDLALENELRSYTALALYENTYRFVNTGSTGVLSVDEWRRLLSPVGRVTKESYANWKVRTLKPAMAELHSSALNHIELSLVEAKVARKVVGLKFQVKRKAQPQLPFSGTPVSNDKKIVAGMKELGLDDADIAQFFKDHDPGYLRLTLEYVRKQVAKGGINSPKAYFSTAVKNNYVADEARAAEEEARRRREKEAAAQARRLAQDFKTFQEHRLREKFQALSIGEKMRRFVAFISSDVVTQPAVREVIDTKGLEVLTASGAHERSATATFFLWLREQTPPLLTTPEELDITAFAQLAQNQNRGEADAAS